MKPFNSIFLFTLVASFMLSFSGFGQVTNDGSFSIYEDWFNIGIHNSCESFNDGVISLQADKILSFGYDLPFDVDLEYIAEETVTPYEITDENPLYINELMPGEYLITIHVSATCEATYQITIAQEVYRTIPASITVTDSDHAHDCKNGSIDLTIHDAVYPIQIKYSRAPFLYSFKNINLDEPSTTGEEDISELRAENYLVEIFDADCKRYRNEFLVDCNCVNDCTLSADVKNVTCSGGVGQTAGEIEVSISCESAHTGWSYIWNDGSTNKNRTELEAGSYCLTVTDEDGCKSNKCWTIAEEGTVTCSIQASGSEDWCIRVCACSNNGQLVSSELIPSELGQVHHGLTRCKADVFCNGEKVGRKNKGYVKVWAFFFDYPNFEPWNYDHPCARYKVCPLDNVGWGFNDEMMRLTPISSNQCIIKCRGSIFASWELNPYWLANCCGSCEAEPIPTALVPTEIDIVIRGGVPTIYTIGTTPDKSATYVKESNQSLVANDLTNYPGINAVEIASTTEAVFYAGDFDFQILEPFNIEYGGGSKDIFVIKYNSDGTEDWATYFGSGGDDYLTDITVVGDKVFVTGNMGDDFEINEEIIEVNGSSAFVFELDTDGTLLGYNFIGSDQSVFGTGSFEKNDGSVITFGQYSGQLFFDDQLVSSTFESDKGIYLTSLNAEREVNWTKSFESSGEIIGDPIVTEVGSNSIIINSFTQSYKIPSESLNQNFTDNNTRYSVTSISTDGMMSWNTIEGSSTGSITATGIVELENQAFMVAGHFSDEVTFSNGQTLIASGLSDIFLAKYNSAGQLFWLKREGGISDEYCMDILTSTDGDIVYAGYFEGEQSTIEGVSFASDASNVSDFLVYLQSAGDLRGDELLQKQELENITKVNIYPNPVLEDIVNIEITSSKIERVSIDIINVSNQVLLSRNRSIKKGVNSIALDLSSGSFSDGVYFIRITDTNGNQSQSKIVKFKK